MFLILFSVNKDASFESKRVHLDNLYRMVSYCENAIDCRRAQQLEYFGERFDRQYCREISRAVCDVCNSSVSNVLAFLLLSVILLLSKNIIQG